LVSSGLNDLTVVEDNDLVCPTTFVRRWAMSRTVLVTASCRIER
jgi:hypothetical protein